MTAGAVVAATISVIATAPAEQENENDDQEKKTHGATSNLCMRAVLIAGAQDNALGQPKFPPAKQPAGWASPGRPDVMHGLVPRISLGLACFALVPGAAQHFFVVRCRTGTVPDSCV
jgi:hypothetical protein